MDVQVVWGQLRRAIKQEKNIDYQNPEPPVKQAQRGEEGSDARELEV
jgi:hypothetical protein